MADEDDIGGYQEDVAEEVEEFDVGEEEEEKEREVQRERERNDPMESLLKHHPECILDYSEIVGPKLKLLASPPLDKDPNHRSVPFLTQYEKTKIIGLRANQLSQGARPYIDMKNYNYITDVCEISRIELQQRKLPFIVRRQMPDGNHEYWKLSDLLIL